MHRIRRDYLLKKFCFVFSGETKNLCGEKKFIDEICGHFCTGCTINLVYQYFLNYYSLHSQHWVPWIKSAKFHSTCHNLCVCVDGVNFVFITFIGIRRIKEIFQIGFQRPGSRSCQRSTEIFIEKTITWHGPEVSSKGDVY